MTRKFLFFSLVNENFIKYIYVYVGDMLKMWCEIYCESFEFDLFRSVRFNFDLFCG